jgi:peptide/nickel transport system substrate-binding protein
MKTTRRFFPTAALVAALGLAWGGAALAATSLVVAVDTPPRMMNPHGDDSDAGLSYMANLFDGLLQRVAPDGELAPALAERYEHPDLLTWKFYLRKGVTFHNGNPFTAADVKFTFDRLSDPEVSEFLNTGKALESVEVVDDYTVVIKTKESTPWFANNMHQIFIMDKESTEGRDAGDVMVHPIGTGAYRLDEWVKGSYLRLKANANYWGGAPTIETINIRPITEASTRFAALASGEADIVTGIPVELFERVRENPKLEVVSRPARRSIFLALGNKSGTPWADLRVRKAIYQAIDEDEIVAKIMRGHATPAAQIPDPPTIGHNPSIQRLPYDPAAARKLLAEAGYADGFEITLSGPNDRYVQDAKIAEAVARYLAKVGIKVNLDVKPKSIFFPDVTKGVLDFYLIGWFDGTFDMGRTFFKLAHSRDESKGYGGFNGTAYADAEIDALLESTATIVDPAGRKAALEDLNRMAMVDKIAWIPLHFQEDLYAMQKDRGIRFQPRPDRWMVYKEISR